MFSISVSEYVDVVSQLLDWFPLKNREWRSGKNILFRKGEARMNGELGGGEQWSSLSEEVSSTK